METVSHGGHFQVAFSTDGQASFRNPDSYTDFKATAVNGITLPDVVCERCVLRLIQVMTDRCV